MLDNGAEPTKGTVLCVHGNPTWSYLWRRLLAGAPPGWRVLAPDHLGMGFSQRLDAPRRLEQRVEDLSALTNALDVSGPVVTVGHDWGGAISLGWAVAHRDQVRGVVLGNTAVAQPPGDRGPALIRLAHSRVFREAACVRTPVFVRSTTALSRPALPPDVRRALAMPYRSSQRRRSVGDFVADIPFEPGHPTLPYLETVAAQVRSLDVPALLLWGPRDPVFGEKYLDDLRSRLPHAQLHRFEGASHLVTEDAPRYAEAVATWLADAVEPGLAGTTPPRDAGLATPSTAPTEVLSTSPGREPGPGRMLWSALEERAQDPGPAVVEVGGASVSWASMADRVRTLAAGMAAAGVRPGQRVALLVEPSAELMAVLYAVWRAGAVVVVADKGLGFTGMRRALRGAAPDHIVGSAAGLAAARAMGLTGSRIAVGGLRDRTRRALGAAHDLDELAALGRHSPAPATPALDRDCAVVFTSGATGPAKGVVYRHAQVLSQIELVTETNKISPADRFVAAFAPFALLGPALGIASAIPDVDVTAPGTLTAAALAEAVKAAEATIVFASPAALRNVLATTDRLTPGDRTALRGVRLLMSAGAPVPIGLLQSLEPVLPAAELHTPYGMTEALPVTDVSLEEIVAAGPGNGVCVGRPVAGVEVRISPLDGDGSALEDFPGRTGEICVRSPHVKDRYDNLWMTQRESSRPPGWHRTGDVGHLDDEHRLWVEGRLGHVIHTAGGPVTPVGIEQAVERLAGVDAAAAVGVGPRGSEVVAVVVVASGTRSRRRPLARTRLADADLTADVRAAAGTPVAAVLNTNRLPVDIRHASKVDRAAVSARADRVLAGRR